MVRNISDTGAMLDVTNPIELPEQFTLALPAAYVLPRRMAQGKADRCGIRLEPIAPTNRGDQ